MGFRMGTTRQIPSQYRRQLLLSVTDGDLRLTPILFQWNSFARVELVLRWCIANRLTGKNLFEWLQLNFQNSIMGPIQFILMKIDRDPEYKPIRVGRDYLPGVHS